MTPPTIVRQREAWQAEKQDRSSNEEESKIRAERLESRPSRGDAWCLVPGCFLLLNSCGEYFYCPHSLFFAFSNNDQPPGSVPTSLKPSSGTTSWQQWTPSARSSPVYPPLPLAEPLGLLAMLLAECPSVQDFEIYMFPTTFSDPPPPSSQSGTVLPLWRPTSHRLLFLAEQPLWDNAVWAHVRKNNGNSTQQQAREKLGDFIRPTVGLPLGGKHRLIPWTQHDTSQACRAGAADSSQSHSV
eukprot:1159564-Pelagomonas_calceolata.AAC.9